MSHLDVRIESAVYREMLRDLQRPHPHAFERVGFALCRYTEDCKTVFPVNYRPVADDDYIPDDSVGARICSTPLRTAIENAIEGAYGVFHVHMHEHAGVPDFSLTDVNFLNSYIPALKGAHGTAPHGALLLSKDSMIAQAWLPNGKIVRADKILVVGTPMKIWRTHHHAST